MGEGTGRRFATIKRHTRSIRTRRIGWTPPDHMTMLNRIMRGSNSSHALTRQIHVWSRTPYNPTAYDDDWEDQPRQGAFYQWGLGLLLPLALLSYGVNAIVHQHVLFGRNPMELNGFNAIAFGIAWASAGIFVHCHYFWGNIYNQAWFAVLGKIISACGFIAGLGVVLVRNGVLGIG